VVGFNSLSGLHREKGADVSSFLQKSLKLQQIRQKNVILQQFESEEYYLVANMLRAQIINNGK
jgi:hypothetical protein